MNENASVHKQLCGAVQVACAKPVHAKPVRAKPVHAKPVCTKPVRAKPVHAPGQAALGPAIPLGSEPADKQHELLTSKLSSLLCSWKLWVHLSFLPNSTFS